MPTLALQRFVDDELMRAPMVMDLTLQSVFEALQRGPAFAGAAERQVAGEVILKLGAQRPRIVAAYLDALRQQVALELGGKGPAAPPPPPAMPKLAPLPVRGGLSLVEDEDVAADVAMSHAIEMIRSVAEAEIRELLSFTSALADDMDVARDHNPLRPDVQARCLWTAAQALPLSRTHQLAFMRMAALPFAQALRKGYAAACSRLEEQGVEPAAYRTLILPKGVRRQSGGGSGGGAMAYAQRGLNEQIDRATPYSTQPGVGAPPGVLRAPAPSPYVSGTFAPPPMPVPQTVQASARHTTQMSDNDARLAGLVDQLFDTMMADRRLPAEMQAPLLRLQACATKAVQADEEVLDRHTHAMWRFIDLLTHEAAIYPGPNGTARDLLLRFAAKLIDQLVQETRHSEPLYVWAIERLDRFVAKRLAERMTAAESRIAELHALEERIAEADAPVSTLHGAPDLAHLETVPADLMDAPLQSEPPDRLMTSSRWLLERRSGDWLKLFRKGQWGYAQLLWPGERGEMFLFADGDTDECWAIRRSALLGLRDSSLATMAWPRSLVGDATGILLRRGQR